MSQTNFQHLEEDFPILYNIGLAAEYNLHNYPVTSLFKLRQFIERFTEILFDEHCMNFPYDNTIHNTGIDVPSITNLVFMRRIRSSILYEQMLGRATRLCPEIGKEVFHIYDAVRIYEALQDYTQMKPVTPNPSATFKQLSEEISLIVSSDRIDQQVEQIIAKIQRKKQHINGAEEDKFKRKRSRCFHSYAQGNECQ